MHDIYKGGQFCLRVSLNPISEVVFYYSARMSNWKGFSESQDEDPQTEAEFELSLSQLPDQPLLLRDLALPHRHPRDEAGPSRPLKQPRIERRWHGNLDINARALVILLQVGCVEPGTRDVTFEATYEGKNNDQYFCMVRPLEGSRGHQRWLEGPVNPLTKAERANYVAATIKRILDFLQME